VGVQERIEQAFVGWAHFVVRARWWVLFAALATTGYFVTWVPELTVDNSTESFLRPHDPARADYDAFRSRFGQDERVVVSVQTADLFDLAFLERLRRFHREVEAEVPYVLEVTSLINARNTRGEGDELIVEDLLEEWPSSEADLAQLAQRVRDTPIYADTLVNRAGTVTTVTVAPLIYSTLGAETDALAGFDDSAASEAEDAPAFLTNAEKVALHEKLSAIMERHDGPGFHLGLAGGGVMNIHATDMMMRDIKVFMSACMVVIAALLFAVFRRVSAVLLPALTVLCSLLVTYGVMAALAIPTSLTGQVLPILLVTVGVCSAVHILTIVYQRVEAGASREEALAAALGHSGLAVSMATVTTAGGLVSFVSAELAQIANLGKMAPIGILLTLVFSLTLLPAAIAVFPLSTHPRLGGQGLRARLGTRLAAVGDLTATHPWTTLAGTALVVLVFATGVTKVRFAQDGLRWFPEGDPIRTAVEFLDRELGGVGGYEFVIDTGVENGLHDPEMLRDIERAAAFAEAQDGDVIWVGKTLSLIDIVKETHQALNENRADFYAIPDDRQLLAQELLLFENSGSDDLEDWTDSQFRYARLSVRTPFADGLHTPPLVAKIESFMHETFGPDVEVVPTGLGVLFGKTYSIVNPTMAESYVIALMVITPLMALLIGSVKRGLLAMVPNLIPIWMTLGLMGWLDIPLDNSSLLIGCIVIGLAVDDTIHFMHKFHRYFVATGDTRAAVRKTLETTGAALLFTSVVLASGFAVMTLAYMSNAAQFGMLTCFATVAAFTADILISPALMALVVGREGRAPELVTATAGASDADLRRPC